MFICSVCNTAYCYPDLAEECQKLPLADSLNAEIGEKIIRTRYYGDDYAQPPKKAGLLRLYEWTYVRDKRIVPFSNITWDTDMHVAEYKIGDIKSNYLKIPGFEKYADCWEQEASGKNAGSIFGPFHYWSKKLVESEKFFSEKKWPDGVISMCEGEISEELLEKFRQEGYPIN